MFISRSCSNCHSSIISAVMIVAFIIVVFIVVVLEVICCVINFIKLTGDEGEYQK